MKEQSDALNNGDPNGEMATCWKPNAPHGTHSQRTHKLCCEAHRPLHLEKEMRRQEEGKLKGRKSSNVRHPIRRQSGAGERRQDGEHLRWLQAANNVTRKSKFHYPQSTHCLSDLRVQQSSPFHFASPSFILTNIMMRGQILHATPALANSSIYVCPLGMWTQMRAEVKGWTRSFGRC